MALSKMNVVEWVEDLKQYGITPDEKDVVHMVEDIAKQLKSMMNDKRYKKITNVVFWNVNCDDYELKSLIKDSSDFPRSVRYYSTIVEVLGTASMLGYYISGYYANRGDLWIYLTKDFKYDNITPDLVEFISRTVAKNYMYDLLSDLESEFGIDLKENKENIDELIVKGFENNDIDLGMP